ncbi:hypothetical protein D3870_01540 [Noviherbaspirillum cavernae]|uniref:Cysteine-rich CWC family protein n=1 Tax=Noviherbaspirillum cavernae TaxID=2320862 RepID=A0A418WXC2_9BURK|nr:cysteine-rich CWC family protein [Noviherbaspirillum cavernae]RJG04880.1 hypothetical protein D3870_01540 [Noviherbaspirillum cavernae]
MSSCSRCGSAFECGMKDPQAIAQPCWCTRMPILPASAYVRNAQDAAGSDCFCPQCLRALLDALDAQEAPASNRQ